jgi:hypothetical protein
MTRHELGRFAQKEVDLNKVETLRQSNIDVESGPSLDDDSRI